MHDIEDINDIKLLVDSFYSKIRKDELLSPIFAMRIEKEEWNQHLNRMYGFWNTVLFAGKEYKGNPFSKHVYLPVTEKHFERWVSLFNLTVNELFIGDKAEETKLRVQKMATLFMKKIKHVQDNPNYKSIV